MAIKLLQYKGDIPSPVEVVGSGWDVVLHFPQADHENKWVTGTAGPTWSELNAMNDSHYLIARACDQYEDDAEGLLAWTLGFINDYGHPYLMSLLQAGHHRADIRLKDWREDMRTIRDWTKLAQTSAGRKYLLTGDEDGANPVSKRFRYYVSAVVVEKRGGGSIEKKETTAIRADVAIFPNSIIGWASALIMRDAENAVRYKKCANNTKSDPCDHVVPSRTPVGNKSGTKFCSARCKRAAEIRRRKR